MARFGPYRRSRQHGAAAADPRSSLSVQKRGLATAASGPPADAGRAGHRRVAGATSRRVGWSGPRMPPRCLISVSTVAGFVSGLVPFATMKVAHRTDPKAVGPFDAREP